MRGRKPLPTARHALTGNPGKRSRNAHEPQPPAVDESFDQPPPEVRKNLRASAEWARLAPMLRRCRQITEADRAALIAVCLEWARYLEAMDSIASLGLVVRAPSGYPIPNPYLSIATRALNGCYKLWPELGLTPSSRTRVKVTAPGQVADDFTEFDTPPVVPDVKGSDTPH